MRVVVLGVGILAVELVTAIAAAIIVARRPRNGAR
jgi:hypothetical protein